MSQPNRRSKSAWNRRDDGTEPSLRGVDLADVHPAPRRRKPEWDAPVNSPSIPVFVLGACLGILFAFAVLELAEWIARWGG